MRIIFLVFSLALLVWMAPDTTAQTVSTPEFTVEVTHAVKLGKTERISDRLDIANTDYTKLKKDKKKRKIVQNFAGRGLPQDPQPGAMPQGPDPVWQKSIKGPKNPQTGTRQPATAIEPLINITGLTQGSNGPVPPDPSGDIGKNHYVQMVNATRIRAFHKDDGDTYGSTFSGNSLWTSFGLQGSGDPIVLYDQSRDRWILTEFADPGGPQPNTLFIAISEDEDPLGEYEVYQFGTPNFPDYPKYTIWDDALCITTNEQGPLACYFIDLEALMDGDANPTIQRLTVPGLPGTPGFFVATPVDWSGTIAPPNTTGPMFLRLHDDAWQGNQDQIDVYSAEIDWENENNTNLTLTEVPVADFDSDPCSFGGGFSFACLPQPNGSGVDGLPAIIMHQSHYRNFGTHESMVLNFVVDATGDNVAGIRWIEMRKEGFGDWSVYQEGTFAPDDGVNRFMGSMAMDGAGNIGLAYAVVGPDDYLGLRFTGRRASDPLGEMTVEEYEIKAGGGNTPFDRVGDYAHMSIDPENDRTFWYTGEYQGQNSWGTRIVAFEMTRDTVDVTPTAVLEPAESGLFDGPQQLKVRVENAGLQAQNNFDIAFSLDGAAPIVENVPSIIQPGQSIEHTFGALLDLSEQGDHEFVIYTALEGDANLLNDTLRSVVTTLGRYDIGVTGIGGIVDGCGPATMDLEIELTNFGAETITSANILISVNSTLQSESWLGSLPAGESTTKTITVSGFQDGLNEITAVTSNPNGESDEDESNDSFERSFDYIANAALVVLELRTDFYGSEITWDLVNENGTEMASGGPYADGSEQEIVQEICVNPNGCYTFTIYDSYGDGICCGFLTGNGNYEVIGPDGATVAEGGEFGSSESTEFCLEAGCLLSADYAVTPETSEGANDGTLIVTAQNGVGPYSYSINGGDDFQSSNIFEGLGSGNYEVVIDGGEDCYYEGAAFVPECGITFLAEGTNASSTDSGDATIDITASGGNAPYQYSINGGANFQSSGSFEGLGIGTFDIVITDALGCSTEGDITLIADNVSVQSLTAGQLVEVFPNPTEGEFRINVRGISDPGPFIDMYIYNAEGKQIHEGYLVKYDETYTGLARIFSYPAGAYFVRVLSDDLDYTTRLMKQ